MDKSAVKITPIGHWNIEHSQNTNVWSKKKTTERKKKKNWGKSKCETENKRKLKWNNEAAASSRDNMNVQVIIDIRVSQYCRFRFARWKLYRLLFRWWNVSERLNRFFFPLWIMLVNKWDEQRSETICMRFRRSAVSFSICLVSLLPLLLLFVSLKTVLRY